MRRFLVSYEYSPPQGFGFGTIYHERADGKLPDPQSLADLRQDVAKLLGLGRDRIVILAISEVSAEGEVVT
jgi:hypothetical protein